MPVYILVCRYAPPQRKMKTMMPMMGRRSRSSVMSDSSMYESAECYGDSYDMEEDDHTSVNESLTSTK